jgi:GTPase SAR1 family protein
MIIVIDGPEKSGKTTFIGKLTSYLQSLTYDVRLRKWGRLETDDREYTPALKEDLQARQRITIWDRAWPSEHVYGNLLGRDRRLSNDPWLGEWLHRRALIGNGMGIIMLPALAGLNIGMHDETDLPVDVYAERTAYSAYANRFRWTTLMNDYTEEWMNKTVSTMAATILSKFPGRVPAFSRVLFIGDNLEEKPAVPGHLLPFTTKSGIAFARQIGDSALVAHWTLLDNVSDYMLEASKYIVGFGNETKNFLESSSFDSMQQVFTLPFKNGLRMEEAVFASRELIQHELRQVLYWLEETWNETTNI